jgi:glycosyltransferase involved in cell wall biosynthesis
VARREETVPEPARSTLSVILPNYNHGRFIGRAVTALLSQERKPDEIIIIDDGSTDDSRDIINAISSTSAIVRVLVNGTNKGVTLSLMRGLDAATATYVYLAAADDWVLPGFFAAALQLLESHPQAALVCGEANLVAGRTGKSLGMRPAVRPSARAAYLAPDAVAAQGQNSLPSCV